MIISDYAGKRTYCLNVLSAIGTLARNQIYSTNPPQAGNTLHPVSYGTYLLFSINKINLINRVLQV